MYCKPVEGIVPFVTVGVQYLLCVFSSGSFAVVGSDSGTSAF